MLFAGGLGALRAETLGAQQARCVSVGDAARGVNRCGGAGGACAGRGKQRGGCERGLAHMLKFSKVEVRARCNPARDFPGKRVPDAMVGKNLTWAEGGFLLLLALPRCGAFSAATRLAAGLHAAGRSTRLRCSSDPPPIDVLSAAKRAMEAAVADVEDVLASTPPARSRITIVDTR